MKVAKLVTITLMARVIVDEDDDKMTILETALPTFVRNIEGGDMFNGDTEIKDDTECPYNPEEDEENTDLSNPFGITQAHLNKASEYLTSYEDNDEAKRWISKIIQHAFTNPIDIIENVDDDITVWEKLEFSLSCEEFLDLIGFDLEAVRQ